MGTAMMGTGEATGDRRAILAAEEAIANPLLDDVTLRGARGLLLSITGGRDLTLYEVDEAASRVREEVDPDCNIIVGATFDESLGDRVRVSIVASGMRRAAEQAAAAPAPAQSAPVMPKPSPASANNAQLPPASVRMMPPQQHYGGPPLSQHHHAAASSPPAPGEDIHRRLTEAIGAVPSQGPVTSPSPQGSYDAPRPRENWAAPNNVLIEEGFTPPAHRAPQAFAYQAAPAEPSQSGGYPAQGFEPQPPAEVRRAQRRLPSVEDFPAVGQREWHARQQGTVAQPTEEPRKSGFFGRLTGMGKKAAPAPDGLQTSNDSEAPLPVFFGRERR